MRRSILVLALLAAVSGCGDSPSATPTAPTQQTPSPTPQNRAPAIASLSVSPDFVVAGLGTITYSVSASDPDNDPLSFRWVFGDLVRTDASGTFTPTTPLSRAELTVTDSRGSSVTDARSLVVAALSGTWSGTDPTLGTYTFVLTHNGIVVTGTYQDRDGGGRVRPEDGRIDQNGHIEMRVKQEPYLDYFFRGQVDRTTGRTITGGIFESGFRGEPFVLTKQ